MKKILPIAIILPMLLTSCRQVRTEQDKLQVFTSFYAMYDFSRTIGGDDIDLTCVVPSGAEPHDFEPTASDMAKLSNADVFIYNGSGIDDWAKKIADTLPESVEVICTSDSLTLDENDPHVWLNTDNAKKQLEVICDALSASDSENAQNYSDRLTSYTQQLDSLTAQYSAAGLDGKQLFVTHGAYGYLCDQFGMEQHALEGISGDSDPSPAQMAKIVDEIKESGAPYIFFDPLEGDKTAQSAAKEAGIEALELYTFEGDSLGRDYLTIMNLNLEQLKRMI